MKSGTKSRRKYAAHGSGNIFRKGDAWFGRWREIREGALIQRCVKLADFDPVHYKTSKDVRPLLAKMMTGAKRAAITHPASGRDFIDYVENVPAGCCRDKEGFDLRGVERTGAT